MGRILLLLLFLSYLTSTNRHAMAQVDDIKSASTERAGSRRSESSRNSSNSFHALDIINISAHALIEWQRIRLQMREQNPSMVSVEVIAVAAVQPSSYYIVHPRIRGNWGIFSTDFRMNYLIEEDVDGIKHLRTEDWQILQLNLIAHRNVNLYVGGGFLREAFGGRAYYNEWTTCLRVNPAKVPFSLQAEYRYSEPRVEFSTNVQYPVLRKGMSNIYLLAGGAFQEYYSNVRVWGLQGGIMLKVY
jgi:hypothetical protein